MRSQVESALRQARDRLHRIGQEGTVTAYYLIAAHNPVDQFFRTLCLEKAQLTSAVLAESVHILAEEVIQDEDGKTEGVTNTPNQQPASHPATVTNNPGSEAQEERKRAKTRERVRRHREKDPEAYRAYMREYMRRRRAQQRQ